MRLGTSSKRILLFGFITAAVALLAFSRGQAPPARTTGAAPTARIALNITFGELQEREADYSGTITLSEGRVVELIPWRFFGADKINAPSSWTLHTRRANIENQPDQPR